MKIFVLVLAGLLLMLGLAPAGASSANISRSYQSSSEIKSGSIVSLSATKSDVIDAANADNGSRLIGIAVATNDSLLAVDESADKVQVATSGNAKALVSTLNGPIKVGDQVAVSPFSGVGMKATPGSRVIGVAQSPFAETSQDAMTQEVTSKSGETTEVSIGYVNISIAIGTSSNKNGDENLSSLQKLGKSITGRTVSTMRVILSLAIALVALASLVTLIYASIYGGIISVGRNPLAKYAVYRSISSVLLMVAITAVIAGFTIFLLLR